MTCARTMVQVLEFPSPEALTDRAARLLADTLTDPAADRPFAVGLSGGRSPREVYARAAALGPASAFAHVVLCDERMAPPGSPDTNLHLVRPLAEALRIPSDRVLAPDTRSAPEAAANTYHSALAGFLESGGSIPLALLGLGTDGHTCSLFSPTDLPPADRLAAATGHHAGFDRVSVTPAWLARVRHLVFLVRGEDKREALRALLFQPRTIPAGVAMEGHARVSVYTELRGVLRRT